MIQLPYECNNWNSLKFYDLYVIEPLIINRILFSANSFEMQDTIGDVENDARRGPLLEPLLASVVRFEFQIVRSLGTFSAPASVFDGAVPSSRSIDSHKCAIKNPVRRKSEGCSLFTNTDRHAACIEFIL